MLKWHDENRAGKKDFMEWTAFKHPALGEVEIGGFNPKFYSLNPPPDLIETWARNEAMFNLYLAQQLPQVKIVSATSKPSSTAGVFDVELVVTNVGRMPTALDIAKVDDRRHAEQHGVGDPGSREDHAREEHHDQHRHRQGKRSLQDAEVRGQLPRRPGERAEYCR